MADEDVNIDALFFTKTHEWVAVEGESATIGISNYAQEQLGDVVAIELPEPGASFALGDEAALIDTVKKTEPIYAPVSGTVTEVHDDLAGQPELINEHPYSEGWMFKLTMSNPDELKGLMSAGEYEKFCQEHED